MGITGHAQISHGGQPLPFTSTKSQAEACFVQMPTFDLEEQLRIDSLEATDLRNGYRFAYKFMTNYNSSNSGIRFTLPDGTKVWRLGIYSPNAYSLNVMFSEYHLPKGARLFLYNENQTEVLGSFNHLNNSPLNLLPIAPIIGDKIIIEYQEPAHVPFPGKLTLGEVNHGYRHFRASEPQPDQSSFWCMPPVACFQDTTNQYNQIERSVLLLIINGTTSCTGTLINNTSNDKRPYILTASHCLNGQFQIQSPDYEEIAGSIICYFNYNSPQCAPVEPGETNQTMASAHFRAAHEQTDMALLELYQQPPSEYKAYYAGWNAQNQGDAPYSCIHHPNGSPKRIVVAEGEVELTSYVIPEIDFNPNSHWKVARWAIGCTAAGSSGSPLFDANNHIIGGLTGGSSYCNTPVNDYYFSIHQSWSTPTDSSRQLKYWLDPIGHDTPPICEGLDTQNPTGTMVIAPIGNPIISVDKHQQQLHISLKDFREHATIILVSLDGKIIRQYAINSQETNIKVAPIYPVIYIAKVVYNNKIESQKVIF
ncbi:MAG: trypsin-like peptidase domain-containing protein [Parabacteroides sp.]|nr:trypsin-like peptidase domain-containing protein [Parabacteroides sp.]